MTSFSRLMSPSCTSHLFSFNTTMMHYTNRKQKCSNHLSSSSVYRIILVCLSSFISLLSFSYFTEWWLTYGESGAVPPPVGMEWQFTCKRFGHRKWRHDSWKNWGSGPCYNSNLRVLPWTPANWKTERFIEFTGIVCVWLCELTWDLKGHSLQLSIR